MKVLRLALASLALCVGTIASLIALLFALGPGVAETVEHSKELARTFNVAGEYVTSFKRQFGRLPSSQEFEKWASSFPSRPYSSPNGMTLESPPFLNEELTKQFGTPPEGSYLLVYWRGEWYEYYAGWVNRTSLELDESKYYALGNKLLDAGAVFVFAVLALYCGYRIWPNRTFHRTASGVR